MEIFWQRYWAKNNGKTLANFSGFFRFWSLDSGLDFGFFGFSGLILGLEIEFSGLILGFWVKFRFQIFEFGFFIFWSKDSDFLDPNPYPNSKIWKIQTQSENPFFFRVMTPDWELIFYQDFFNLDNLKDKFNE